MLALLREYISKYVRLLLDQYVFNFAVIGRKQIEGEVEKSFRTKNVKLFKVKIDLMTTKTSINLILERYYRRDGRRENEDRKVREEL